MKGYWASSHSEGEVSWFFWTFSGNLGYILQLRLGWPFKTRVFLTTSGLICRYEGHLRNLHEAWQCNTEDSRGEAADPWYLSSCHSDIGIPFNFQEETGIITF